MANLKERLRERLNFLDTQTRERAIVEALDALDRPTLLMVEEGAAVLDEVTFDQKRGAVVGDRELCQTIFARMVDAGRRGA